MKKLRVTVDGKTYDVEVQMLDEGAKAPPPPASTPSPAPAPKAAISSTPISSSATPGDVPSPLSGKVVSIDVKEGQVVAEGQQLLTLEAMKMNTYINAPKAGKVEKILVHPGDLVQEGQPLIKLT